MLFFFGYLFLARHGCGHLSRREQQCIAIIDENFQDMGACFALLNTARIVEIRTPFDETLNEKEFVALNDADCRDACANNIPDDCPANLAFFHANLLLKKKMDVDRTLVEKDFENFESKCNNAPRIGDTVDSENSDMAMMGLGLDSTMLVKETCALTADLFDRNARVLCGTPVQRGPLTWQIVLFVTGILLYLACYAAIPVCLCFIGGRPKADEAVPPVLYGRGTRNIQEFHALLKVNSS